MSEQRDKDKELASVAIANAVLIECEARDLDLARSLGTIAMAVGLLLINMHGTRLDLRAFLSTAEEFAEKLGIGDPRSVALH